MRADRESYRRLNKPVNQLQITCHINVKPEIGFAAGAGEGMIDGEDGTVGGAADETGAAAAPSCASLSFNAFAN